MNLTIEVQGLAELHAGLRDFSDRRLDASTATGLTRVTRAVAESWRQQLASRFDRPTPATTRAVVTTMATARKLEAEVRIRDQGSGTPPVAWLAPEEFGGGRLVKKFERALQAQGSMPAGSHAVPGPAAKLDAYGNVSRSQIVQVIAQLGAQFSPGYARVISPSAGKRAAKALATGRAYIAITDRRGRLSPGVYERNGRRLSAVFYFVSGAQYRKRTDLIDTAKREAPALLDREIGRAIQESAARLAARRAGQ